MLWRRQAAGVKILLGSDRSVRRCLGGARLRLALAGRSALRMLQSTTLDAAEYLNRADIMGTVGVGKVADLVVLKADPSDGVQNVPSAHRAVRGGRHYSNLDLAAIEWRLRRRGQSTSADARAAVTSRSRNPRIKLLTTQCGEPTSNRSTRSTSARNTAWPSIRARPCPAQPWVP